MDDTSKHCESRRTWFLGAIRTSIVTSLLFLLVYPTCNWITSLRTDVGTWYYAWERYIPFVPIMIIPYMSIDLFFVAAPFLCRDCQERRVYAWRMTLAILTAGMFFLVMPLKLAVPRPEATGWLGELFSQFLAMDKPYNLCPSMHIALRTILADLYARHSRGMLLRVLSDVWFSLIGFSTLLTHQHHVVDVIGGFMLAFVCMYLVRQTPLIQPVLPNRRVGSYYAVGAIALSAIAVWLGGWGLWLLWPAFSFGLVAAAYFWLGPGVYRKSAGVIPRTAKLIHAPVLFGQWLSLLYYRRQCRAWDKVTEKLWIGRVLTNREAKVAVEEGVTAVLDLTAEFSEAKPFFGVDYCNVPILDLTAPTVEQLEKATEFIRRASQVGVVYVHCKVGYSRSAAVVGEYLLSEGLCKNVEEVVKLLRGIRPTIVIRPEVRELLKRTSSTNA